jgi:hypothetical protein
MTKTKSLIIATAALAATFGAMGPAQAGGLKKHKWRHGIHINIGSGYYGGYYAPCHYERRMWRRTGSWFWRNQYHACMGW